MHNYSHPQTNHSNKSTSVCDRSLADIRAKSCSIVGARGYSGIELAKILLRHPYANLVNCFATSEFRLDSYLNHPRASAIPALSEREILDHQAEVVFLATPAEVSLELAPKLLEQGSKVIDLSGAFRLKQHDYKKWYGFSHTQREILQNSVYGLVPWQTEIASEFGLIANPGCYATAINLALLPLLKNNLISEKNIVIDAKSGTSGAGRKATENMMFTEVDGECLPYKVGKHQHYPEILEALEHFAGKKIETHLTTSLLPVRRGIIAGVYAQLNESITEEHIYASYAQFYAQNKLIQFGHLEANPHLVSLKRVVGTARTHISFKVEGGRLYVFACIDNLLKGAASQAVENFNRLIHAPSETALWQMEALI